jgi:hypothetical protein
MSWIDRKFVNYVGPQLRNFKWTDNTTARASCPVCGDSHKNKFKTRFFFLKKGNNYMCYCHNCGYSAPLRSFLETYYPHYHSEYLMDVLRDKRGTKPVEQKIEVPVIKQLLNPLRQLTKISDLDDSNPGKMYCVQRKIPTDLLC